MQALAQAPRAWEHPRGKDSGNVVVEVVKEDGKMPVAMGGARSVATFGKVGGPELVLLLFCATLKQTVAVIKNDGGRPWHL